MKMKCPACGFKNEEGANFCSNCNEPLVTTKVSINKENSNIKKEISNNTEKTNIKRVIKKERLRMNKKQRVILAIFIPVLLFFIALTIAYYISVEEIVISSSHTTSKPTNPNMDPKMRGLIKFLEDAKGNPDWQPGDRIYTHHPAVTRKSYDPYNWQRTWYVWLLFLTFCCFFEYKLFEDKEIISNKKNKELR